MLEHVAVPPLSLDAYAPVAGDDAVAEIRSLAADLQGARVLHVNATKFGGGVAEILPTLTALMRDAGLDAEWRIIPGDDAFFEVTKRIHNGLQGADVTLDQAARDTFERATDRMVEAFEGDYDFIVIHDPQPAAMRRRLPDAAGKWIWRCHIDLTAANPDVWGFIRPPDRGLRRCDLHPARLRPARPRAGCAGVRPAVHRSAVPEEHRHSISRS